MNLGVLLNMPYDYTYYVQTEVKTVFPHFIALLTYPTNDGILGLC